MEQAVVKYVYGAAMAFLGTVCCVGYLILGCLLRRRPDLKDKNRFLISLAFSDLLIVCHTFSSAFAAFYGKWPFGDSGCKVDAFVAMAFTLVSIGNVKSIAEDKYMQTRQTCQDKKGNRVHVKWQWAYGIIAGLLPFVGFGSYGFETDDHFMRTGCMLRFHEKVNIKYAIYIAGITWIWFVYPLFVIIKSYSRPLTTKSSPNPLVYIVPLQLLVTLTPYAVYAIFSVISGGENLPHYWVAMNNIAAKTFIATNPFIYVWEDPTLKKLFQNLVYGVTDGTEEEKKEY